ncbi:MAG: hypothetical protein GX024_02655 [Clostridiales bacterium]|nr:hypothetical protein [Clostridiales bacterium]
MDYVCPLCNGMTSVYEFCDKCGTRMSEEGRIEDIKGPYSSYMDIESFYNDLDNNIIIGDYLCVHLYYCERCSAWKHRAVQPKLI